LVVLAQNRGPYGYPLSRAGIQRTVRSKLAERFDTAWRFETLCDGRPATFRGFHMSRSIPVSMQLCVAVFIGKPDCQIGTLETGWQRRSFPAVRPYAVPPPFIGVEPIFTGSPDLGQRGGIEPPFVPAAGFEPASAKDGRPRPCPQSPSATPACQVHTSTGNFGRWRGIRRNYLSGEPTVPHGKVVPRLGTRRSQRL